MLLIYNKYIKKKYININILLIYNKYVKKNK